MPRVVGTGIVMAVTLALFEYTGGRLSGFRPNPEIDEFERKEQLRKNRRRPIEETVSELGEGRCECTKQHPTPKPLPTRFPRSMTH